MDKIKKLTEDKANEISTETGFNMTLIQKDYYATAILYLLKDVKGLYFKGGTALQKTFLDYSRLSEDVDYTLAGELSKIRKEIIRIIEDSGIFHSITKDKDVEGFLRLILHYKKFSGEEDTVFIDLNSRAKLAVPPEVHKIKHFYTEEIPPFTLVTVAKEEMIAEKMAATIGRNKPRDHFDLYKILQKKHPINLAMVKKKCEESGDEFNIIKMFNNAKKLKNRWDDDMEPLLAEKITFEEVMKTLARHFKLKEEKEKKKEK